MVRIPNQVPSDYDFVLILSSDIVLIPIKQFTMKFCPISIQPMTDLFFKKCYMTFPFVIQTKLF